MALSLTGSPPITAAALDAAVNTELTTNWFPLAGVTTNSNAAAGNIGEYISSSIAVGSAVSLTTAVGANVTSISLTAGDWDVWGVVMFTENVATVVTQTFGSINTTSATYGGQPNGGGSATWAGSVTGAPTSLGGLKMRQSLATTTTLYLNAQAAFTTNTMAAYGFIGARRIR